MDRAIVFDFDGTVADTIPTICRAINLTMEKYGLPTHTNAEVRTYINNGPRMLIKRALPPSHREDEAFLDRIQADYGEIYRSVCIGADRLYDGVHELICALRAEGYRIGILSNKQDYVLRPMCETLLKGDLDAVLGSLPDHPTKPHAYLSRKIASMLGVAPENCILVGDSDVDVQTAKNAGMEHIGVTWGYRDADFLRESGARHLASTPKELYRTIKKLTNGKED